MLVAFFISFFAVYQRRQLKFKADKLELEKHYTEEILKTRLETNEQLLRTVSEELHDNVGQSIIAATLMLGVVDSVNYKEQVATSSDLLRRALGDLRDISKSLNGDFILHEGLQSAVEREVEMVCRARKLHCSVSGDSLERIFSKNTEIMIFRCIQETISNAIKHADAKELKIAVQRNGTTAKISISDNGRGLPADWESRKSIGMSSLSRRVELAGGKLHISSMPNKGTAIELTIPIEEYE